MSILYIQKFSEIEYIVITHLCTTRFLAYETLFGHSCGRGSLSFQSHSMNCNYIIYETCYDRWVLQGSVSGEGGWEIPPKNFTFPLVFQKSSDEFLGWGYAVPREKILVPQPTITSFLSEFRGKTRLKLLKRPAAGDFF